MNEVICYGGITPSQNMKAFLRLAAKFRIFPKPQKEYHKVQCEGRSARQRWVIRDKAANPGEDFEQYRRRKEREADNREPYNRERKKVNFTRTRATSLLCNKTITMPAPAPEHQEMKIQGEQIDLIEAWDFHMLEHKDENGRYVGANNLSKEEALGRREIQQGIKEKNWKLYMTDKSGKLCLDTEENFLKSMEEHYVGEQEVTMRVVKESEGQLNNHSKAWASILNLGGAAGEGQSVRIKQALMVHDSPVPVMLGLRKDHKRCDDPIGGPPLRPLMNGKIGPNAPLANLIARVLRPIRSDIQDNLINTEVLSTEEVLYFIHKFNVKEKEMGRLNLPRGCKAPPYSPTTTPLAAWTSRGSTPIARRPLHN